MKMLKSLMSPNCRYIKNKWVFKITCNGVHQVHLVAHGYSQVPGVNFSKNNSPVASNITFHISPLMLIHFGYLAKIIDAEMTFLYGELKEKSIWSVLKVYLM